MRGRVMALYSIVFLGSTPLGGPLTGWLGEAVSPRASLVMAGVGALLVAAAAVLTWHDRDIPTPAEAEAEERTSTRRASRRIRGEHGLTDTGSMRVIEKRAA
jgi:predicted MFS family arabinose efflux permease